MTQKKLMIDLPQSSEALHNVLQFLLKYGLISKKKARMIEKQRSDKKEKPVQQNRWAAVAEDMAQKGYLNGHGDELIESINEFRQDFEINDPFDQPAK